MRHLHSSQRDKRRSPDQKLMNPTPMIGLPSCLKTASQISVLLVRLGSRPMRSRMNALMFMVDSRMAYEIAPSADTAMSLEGWLDMGFILAMSIAVIAMSRQPVDVWLSDLRRS